MKRFLTLFLVFFTCACEVIVDVDDPFEGEKLVVGSFVCPDSLWSASISLNRSILADDNLPHKKVQNATVTIHDESGPVATLQHVANGNYRSQTEKPLPGKQYTIQVSAPNYASVEAKSTVPNPAAIASVEFEKTVREGKRIEVTKVKFRDNSNTKDFYHIRLEVVDERIDLTTDEVSSYRYPHRDVSSDNPDLNSQYISVDAGLLVKDVLFNGQQTEVRMIMDYGTSLSYLAGIRVVLRSVSEDYYNYMATLKLQDETSGDPFAQPVNVYNNVSNGFGIFSGHSNSSFEFFNPKPVVTGISPSSGKVGDIITITGQNFKSDYPHTNVIVRFKAPAGDRIWADVIEVTDTQVKIVVPEGAVTGTLVVFRDACFTLTDTEFQVIN